jgi:hypothetical protein
MIQYRRHKKLRAKKTGAKSPAADISPYDAGGIHRAIHERTNSTVTPPEITIIAQSMIDRRRRWLPPPVVPAEPYPLPEP